MTLRIELAELGLPAIDALDVDALAVFVGPERPLQGLAGFADWRLCGAISRVIRAGHFSAAAGEALLLPSAARIGPSRVFCFGVGTTPLSADAFGRASRQLWDALGRAGSDSFASAWPPLDPGVPAARLWLEASRAFPGHRHVLLGELRAMQRELSAAKQALHLEVEIAAPTARVELPPRSPSALPSRSAVVR